MRDNYSVLEDQQKFQIRGCICLITESKEIVGINQVTKGGKEYSRWREQHMNNLSDTREWAHLKNCTKFCIDRSRICKHISE